jgi:hypothetical protein
LIELLSDVKIARAVDHVVETLETFVDHDPKRILQRLGRLLAGARDYGYQSESLGETHVMNVVEIYLVRHRSLLLDDAEAREILIAVLVSFAEAGWPRARRVLYGLDDMFR